MSDVGFGLQKKPLILDLSQRAVGIVWAKLNKIEVIQINYSHSHARSGRRGYKQRFSIEDANFDIQSFDPFGTIVIVKPKGKTTPVVDPISDAMRQNLLIWTRGYKKTEDEEGFHERNNVFFNVALIWPLLPKPTGKEKEKAMKYRISFPAVGATTEEPSPMLYYVWLDLTPFPDPGSDLFRQEAPIYLDSIYFDEAEAQARADLLNVHSKYKVYPYAQDPQSVYDRLEYQADIGLYQDRKEFSIDADGVLAKPGDKRKASHSIAARGISGPYPEPLPAKRWEIATNAFGAKNDLTATEV